MRRLGFLLAFIFIASVQGFCQQNWYVRAEVGPQFSFSYSNQNGFPVSETDLQSQFGFSGGTRLGSSYFLVETGIFRQSHTTIARIGNAVEDNPSDLSQIENQYSVYKIPLRVAADLLPGNSKIGFQLLGGTSYLFKPGKHNIGEKVPGSDDIIVLDEQGRAVHISNKYYHAGGWAIEMGMRGSYAINDRFSAELAGGFQIGLRNMATTTLHYDNDTETEGRHSYSRADAGMVTVSLRYNFGVE
jgi:hypothetical protein